MRVLSISELTRMTRNELCDWLVRITIMLADWPEGSPERDVAEINLRNIRHVLARKDLGPDNMPKRREPTMSA
jgi:hypothetical protein